MKPARIVAVFVVEFQQNGERQLWNESLTASLAMALGKRLAREGRKPVVRKLLISQDEVMLRSRWRKRL